MEVFSYYIQHSFICRPSDSTVSEDAGIEPRTVATSALTVTVRRSNYTARMYISFSPAYVLLLHSFHIVPWPFVSLCIPRHFIFAYLKRFVARGIEPETAIQQSEALKTIANAA